MRRATVQPLHRSVATGVLCARSRSGRSLLPFSLLPLSLLVLSLLSLAPAACGAPRALSRADSTAAARAVVREVSAAYDLSRPNVVDNLMGLYAPSGPIVSASAGRVITSRDTLRQGIQAFADNVLRNMHGPRFEWTSMHVDVLAPDVAAMTATYRIPHVQPNGMQHVVGGAWTAVFERIGDRWFIRQEHLSDDPTAR